MAVPPPPLGWEEEEEEPEGSGSASAAAALSCISTATRGLTVLVGITIGTTLDDGRVAQPTEGVPTKKAWEVVESPKITRSAAAALSITRMLWFGKGIRRSGWWYPAREVNQDQDAPFFVATHTKCVFPRSLAKRLVYVGHFYGE